MKIAITFGPMCLTFRGTLEFSGHRQDPRGLTGSEIGFIRIAQELRALGHEVTAYTNSHESEWEGITIRPLDARGEVDETFDAAISINEPEVLQIMHPKVRVCEQWLNSFDYCNSGFEAFVDLWVSPSAGHRDFILASEHATRMTGTGELGIPYKPEPEKWVGIPLGCDPDRYPQTEKVPGRVVYCSSPDRGLHWVLQEWPAIKRAVPNATLKVFYRLQPWIEGFRPKDGARSPRLWFRNQLPEYFPPTEPLLARANYIEETLKRLSGPEWGITVCDSVSREQIEREMCEAEVLAYPVDTIRWSEGFSCTILEACAARACPVLWDCDAIGGIYCKNCIVHKRGDIKWWRKAVIACLQDKEIRDAWNKKARALAEELTWAEHVRRLVCELRYRLPSSTPAEQSKTSSPSPAAESQSSGAKRARKGRTTTTRPTPTGSTS